MAKVTFERIFWKNFNSLSEGELIITQGKHAVIGENLMTGGSNGSAKSSIFETMPYTIYKRYDRGNDPSRNGKGNCMTGLEFTVDGNRYRTERYFKVPSIGNGSKLFVNDEDVSARLATATDEEILKIVGIPYDLFVSTCVVLQGIPINFTKFTPAVRKSIIEGALGFQVWDDIRERFISRKGQLASEQQECQNEYQETDRVLSSLQARIEAMESSQDDNKEQILSRIKVIKEEIKALNSQASLVKSKFDQSLGGKTMVDWKKEHLELNRQVHSVETRIRDLKCIIEEKTCPTCGTPYPESRMAESQVKLDECNKLIGELLTKFESVQSSMNRLETISQKLKESETKILMKKRELTQANQELLESQDSASEDTKKLKDEHEKLVNSCKTIQEKIQELEPRVQNLDFIDKLLLPSSQFRTQVLMRYLSHISDIMESISPMIASDIKVRLSINSKATGIDIPITRGGKEIEYKQLSGGEKRRLDVIVILSFQRFLMEMSGVQTNLVVLDECFDGLDKHGVDAVLACIDTLYPDDSAVYVVSHNDEIKSRFNDVIRVVKGQDGVSRVVS